MQLFFNGWHSIWYVRFEINALKAGPHQARCGIALRFFCAPQKETMRCEFTLGLVTPLKNATKRDAKSHRKTRLVWLGLYALRHMIRDAPSSFPQHRLFFTSKTEDFAILQHAQVFSVTRFFLRIVANSELVFLLPKASFPRKPWQTIMCVQRQTIYPGCISFRCTWQPFTGFSSCCGHHSFCPEFLPDEGHFGQKIRAIAHKSKIPNKIVIIGKWKKANNFWANKKQSWEDAWVLGCGEGFAHGSTDGFCSRNSFWKRTNFGNF